MGWHEVLVAVEYDGEQHRLDREIYRRDLIRSEYIANQGWRRVRVIAGDRAAGIERRVRDAWSLSVLSDRNLA
jgi:very-short-patch-repair endonuclease